ncbi:MULTISPECIES: L-threonylcarbamoyladenylate synthase [Terrabacteria group]|uniref:L-threonylcarbamoyladenylate synthase n=1 Tax=Bacillati TaxID=1783272 RepID=UPI00193A0203|nr:MULTISPECIES: L-threonylcarbamoyladenylate synthase [Terrabacteria group]MBW9212936.1 threonylcarbamoyl-AMP synthase [Trueperella sp. zg.1013]QRG86996.1 threonylcarbamoyl-AMP synthase [Bulleidia sp. zg-1006]
MLICQNYEIDVLVDLLKQDEAVAVPTDTVFGLCARYDHFQAQENLRDLKKRPETKAFPIMCSNFQQVLQICEMKEEEKRVMEQFMPGPLTMILKKKEGVPSFVNDGQDTIAIRLATSPILAEIIDKLGVPVYMTSANLSGEPVALTIQDVPEVKAALNGKIKYGQASTIVVFEQGAWKLLRQGPITLSQIQSLF